MTDIEAVAVEQYDIFTRFARVHLSTRVERAVYLALVGRHPQEMSAAEIASRGGLAARDVERVLEGFAAAGIVEEVDAPHPRRFRWRSDMDYLFGDSGEPSEWVDPVCGMPVWDGSPHLATDNFGRPQRFCSSLCLAAFLAFPNAFTWPSTDASGRAKEPEIVVRREGG